LHLRDATEARGVGGHAVAVVLPGTTGEVAAVLAWCNDRGVPVTPRGGGTGYAAVPFLTVALSSRLNGCGACARLTRCSGAVSLRPA